MPLGKEVADAYIEVHGDLNPFRSDLEDGRAPAAKAGKEHGEEYAEAWEKNAKGALDSKWDSVTKAFYSGKKIDWDRAIGNFDSSNLDEAHGKISGFLDEMNSLGAINEEQWDRSQSQLNTVIKLREVESDLDALKIRQTRKAAVEIGAMRAAQDKYNRSFEGMFRGNQLSDMEADFKKITRAMNDMDFSKWAKGEKSLDNWSLRISETVEAMQRMGRLSSGNAKLISKDFDSFLVGERARRKAVIDTNAEIDRTKESLAKVKSELAASAGSFTRLADDVKRKALHRDFQLMAESVSTMNWSKFAKGHKTMDSLKKRIDEVTVAMQTAGKVNDVEADRINSSVQRMIRNQKAHGVELERSSGLVKAIEFAVRRVQKAWSRTDSTVRLVMTLIAAAAGPVAALASGLAGAGTALVSSLALAAGALVPLITGISALGFGIYLAAKSFDEVRDAIPRIGSSLDAISQNFEDTASAFGRAWGPALDDLLADFSAQMTSNSWGTAFGEAFAEITRGFNDVVSSPGFFALMDAMGTTLPAAVSGLGRGFAGVFQAIISVMAGAAPIAQALGEDFARWGQALGEAAERGRESGQMQAVFEAMRESLLAVLDLAGSISNALGTLFLLGSTSGNSMLASLTGLVDKFNEWMQSTAGRDQLLEWFSNAEAIVRSLAPFLAGLGTALAGLVSPESIGHLMELSEQLGNLLPLVGEILGTISELGILNIFVEGLTAIGEAVSPLLGPLGELNSVLGPSLQSVISALGPLFAGMAAAVAPWIEGMAELVAVVGPQLGPALERMSAALQPVFEIIGKLVSILSGVFVPVMTFIAETVINAVVGAVEGLSDVFIGLVDLMSNLFSGDFAGVWDSLVQIVTGALTAVWNIAQLMIFGKLLSILRNAVTHIPSLFTKAFGGLKKIVGDAFAAIPGLVKAGIAIVAGLLATFGESIASALSGAFTGMGEGISAAFTATMEFLKGIWQGLIDFFTGGWTDVSASASEVFTRIGEIVADAVAGVQAAWGTVVEFFAGVVEGIRATWEPIREFFASLWDGLVTAVTSVFTQIKTTISLAWGAITTIFTTAMDSIRIVIDAGIAIISTVFTGLFAAFDIIVSTGWAVITAAFTLAWETLKTIVAVAILAIQAIFTGNFDQLGVIVSAGWERIKGLFSTFLSTVTGVLSAAWEGIKAITSAVWGRIVSILRTMWTNLKSTVSDGINTAINYIKVGWNAAVAYTSAVWNRIVSYLRTAWTNLKSSISDGINTAKSYIKVGWNAAKGYTSAVWNRIVSFIRRAWINLKTTVSDGISNALTAIRNGWDNAVNATRNAWNNVVSGLQDAWSRAKSAVVDGINAVVKFVRELPGKIKNVFTGLSNDLSRIGSNIIQGLIDGISGMAQRAVNAVGDVINGAIGWAKDLLNINSPSRVFRDIGHNTGEGLALGIEDTVSRVAKSAEKLVDGATVNFDRSKMYTAGQDAGKGLAAGLASEKGNLSATLGGLSGDLAVSAGRAVAPVGQYAPLPGARSAGNQVVIEEGAIQLNSNASDESVLAGKVMDRMSDNFSQFSQQ